MRRGDTDNTGHLTLIKVDSDINITYPRIRDRGSRGNHSRLCSSPEQNSGWGGPQAEDRKHRPGPSLRVSSSYLELFHTTL